MKNAAGNALHFFAPENIFCLHIRMSYDIIGKAQLKDTYADQKAGAGNGCLWG